MATITKRVGRGRNLTAAEVDGNFDSLVTDILGKQPTLTPGVTIKTINGTNPLGAGDISIPGTVAIVVAASTVIPLDTAGLGKYMPQVSLTSNAVYTPGPGPVEGGNCDFSLVGDGTHIPVLSSFQNANGYTYNSAANANNIYSALYQFGSYLLYGQAGTTADLVVPTLTSATVPDSDPLRINLVWSKNMNSGVSAASAFAVSSGHVITAHTYDTATTSHLTLATQFVAGETKTLAYTAPVSNKMQDLAGNLVVSFSGTAITDSVTTPTVTARAVANSSPTHVDLTFSEAMNQTITPSPSDFTVTGHTVTAFTWFSSTSGFLTVTPAFVASESRTVSYTQGTNKLQDLGGTLVASFSGASITDNVSAGGALFSETWPGSLGASLPAGWTVVTGAPTQSGSGTASWPGGGTGHALRDTAVTDMVITAVVVPRGDFPAIQFRSNSTGSNSEFLVFHASTGKLRFYEEVAASDTNIVDGTTTVDLTGFTTYTVRITLSVASCTVELKAGAGSYSTEITATMSQNLSNTYVGLFQGVVSSGSTFGAISAT